MSYVDKNLMEGEEVVYRARLHPIVYSWAILVGLVAVALIVVGVSTVALDWVVWVGVPVLVIAVVLWFVRWVKVRTSEFAVTSKRILIKVGLVRRHSLELLLGKVEGIGVDQDVMGRLLGYGTIVVTGTGGTKEAFKDIARPMEFRRQVQARVSA